MPDQYSPLNPACSGDIMLLIQQIADGQYPWWYPDQAKAKGQPGMSDYVPALAVDFFVYTSGAEFLPLPASVTTQGTVNIDGSSAFFICEQNLIETAIDNVTFLAMNPLLAQVEDTGSARNLQNAPTPVNNIFGTAQRPYKYPIPKLMAPNGTITITLQNLEAVDRNVRISFLGFKIFNFAA